MLSGQFLRNIFLFLLLLLLPNQLGLHIWPSWSFVQGLRIDYLSPTIYLSYLLLFLLVFVFITTCPHPFKSFKRPDFVLLVLPFLFVVIYFSALIPVLSFSKLCQLLISLVLFSATIKFTRGLSWGWSGLSLASIWTSLLAFLQSLSQQSQGLWFLGERDISINTPGIAKISLNFHPFGPNLLQGLFLRPYSSFSHPNSLAGFLLVSFFLTFALRRYLPRPLFITSQVLSAVTIILSGSRLAAVILILLGTFYLLRRLLDFRKLFFLSCLFTLVLFLASITPSSEKLLPSQFLSQPSFSQRVEENKVAISLFISRPIFGVGLGNFIPALGEVIPSFNYPSLSTPTLWLQPVHNIFLLIASEIGFVGLTSLLIILLATVKRVYLSRDLPLLFALLAIILTGLFDHYWLTLIQNQLLFTITLGMIWRRRASRLIE